MRACAHHQLVNCGDCGPPGGRWIEGHPLPPGIPRPDYWTPLPEGPPMTAPIFGDANPLAKLRDVITYGSFDPARNIIVEPDLAPLFERLVDLCSATADLDHGPLRDSARELERELLGRYAIDRDLDNWARDENDRIDQPDAERAINWIGLNLAAAQPPAARARELVSEAFRRGFDGGYELGIRTAALIKELAP